MGGCSATWISPSPLAMAAYTCWGPVPFRGPPSSCAPMWPSTTRPTRRGGSRERYDDSLRQYNKAVRKA